MLSNITSLGMPNRPKTHFKCSKTGIAVLSDETIISGKLEKIINNNQIFKSHNVNINFILASIRYFVQN